MLLTNKELRMKIDLNVSHKFCASNRQMLSNNEVCGCFYCQKIFKANQIKDWLNEGEGTALCPYCSIDSVISEASGLKITIEFLKEMNKYWF